MELHLKDCKPGKQITLLEMIEECEIEEKIANEKESGIKLEGKREEVVGLKKDNLQLE